MSEEIQRLTFKDTPIRTIKRGEELMWCAVDVCRCLEFKNHREAVRLLAEDEKATVKISDGRQGRHAVFVTEPGLYRLIMRSTKPVAKEFQRWVCHDVLPSIRKTGCYFAGQDGCTANTALQAVSAAIVAKAQTIVAEKRTILWRALQQMGVEGATMGVKEMSEEDAREIFNWCADKLTSRGFDADDTPPAWAMAAAGKRLIGGAND